MEFNLLEELTQLSDPTNDYSNFPDLESSDQQEINQLLNQVVDAVSNDSSAITEQDTFDTFRGLIKSADAHSSSTLSKLLDSLISGFQAEIEATSRENNPTDHTAYRSHRKALEMYAFLLQWFVTAAEKLAGAGKDAAVGPTAKGKQKKAAGKKGKKDEFDFLEVIPDILAVMTKALRTLRTERIWQTTAERDTFVANCFMKPTTLFSESEQYMKLPDIKLGVFRVICLAAKNHGQALNTQMTVMQNLQYTEHLSEPMAELCTILAKEFDYSQLGEEVLREIADKQFSAQDTKGPRSFSKFLIKLADISPRVVLKQIVVLQRHLDSESYPMRNAIIEVIGLLIRELSIAPAGDQEPEVIKRQLEGFFELLFDRFLDLNSYVRAKVAAVLKQTCDLPTKFPKLRTKLTELTIRSLSDKSSQVRKNCISLVTKLILTHPYGRMHGGELGMEEWRVRYDELVKELAPLDLVSVEEAEALARARELMGDEDEEGEGLEKVAEEEEEDVKPVVEKEGEEKEEEEEEDGAGSETDEESRPKLSKKDREKKKARRSEGMDLASADRDKILASVDQDTLTRLRLTKKYYADAIVFIEQLDRASEVISDLVASTVKSEVLEAMEFFRVAHQYKLESAEIGVKKMLHLIWAKDDAVTGEDGKELKGVRSKLIDVYTQLYIEEVPDLSDADQVKRVAKNVIELTREATLAELISLEALLGVMMSKGVIQDEVIAKLWQVYSTTKDIPRFQRRGAIIILGMFAAPKPEVVADQVETLLKIGLGPHGKADLVLCKYTCVALSRVAGSVKKVKGSLEDMSVRLPMDSPVFTRLQDMILHPSTNKEWFSMAEQAINTIYTLGDQPDALCSSILRQMSNRVFAPADADDENGSDDEAVPAEVDNDDTATPSASSLMPPMTPGLPPQTPSRNAPWTMPPQTPGRAPHIPVFGNAFDLSQLIFVAGHCAIKQLVHLELVERDIKRRKAEEDAKTGSKKKGQDELDQVAGSVEDEIGDMIGVAKEKELLYGEDSLLSVFGPMAATIVSQPKLYRNSMLKTAATLALSKFMCVSARFCEEHLMLLFRIFETTTEDAVRSNIVIALGDIAVCFSTIMDENSDRLYAGLHDKNITVKKNTLMVLTHLILNGMIKVKGQLGEMAKCLEDEDKRISDLAHLFFTELSTKEKAIYNNLPDIISHLSSGTAPVDEETFAKSMKFIFTFIDKKREAEAIVEKLCQRFQMATEPRQWRDIAFCLSLLPFNSEIAVKKLVEALPLYQDKLHEETVFKRFQEILNKAKNNKVTKDESVLKEFEDALEEHRQKGAEDQDMQRKMAKSKKKGAKASKVRVRQSKRRQQSTPPSSPE
ncbi:hypothetical protein MNV49_000900 [Pseudohyphozyma bogoriensis]|nr:hypothetical protein MNV49_000900 [Pseudohyphozyma bogoriensis]